MKNKQHHLIASALILLLGAFLGYQFNYRVDLIKATFRNDLIVPTYNSYLTPTVLADQFLIHNPL